MMNQGIGSILDSINQALLQYVAAEQVKPVMQQISQALAPLSQGQTMGGSGYGPGMQGSSPLNMSSAVQNAIQNRPTPNLSLSDMAASGMPTPQYMPMDQGNGMDQFNRPMGGGMSGHPAFSGGTPRPSRISLAGIGSFMGNFQ